MDVAKNMKHLKLTGNQKIPVIGLGTWQASSTQDVEDAVLKALELGYRHIDTAFNYNNEEAIGNALKRWINKGAGKREDVFITTKLPHIGNRPQDVERFLKISLDKLQLQYVDLYLIHMPFGFICDDKTLTPTCNESGEYEIDYATDHVATWKVLENQVKDGLTKNIGLSNFNSHQLKRVYDNAQIKPSVLQVELHIYMQQKELRKLCSELGITVTAFSPLGSPGAKFHFQKKYNYSLDKFPNILGHPVVTELVTKYQKSPAQILLNFLMKLNIIVIPKSGNPNRMKENISIFDFDLSEDDANKLESLDQAEKGRIFNFLFFKGIENHPEYPFKSELNM